MAEVIAELVRQKEREKAAVDAADQARIAQAQQNAQGNGGGSGGAKAFLAKLGPNMTAEVVAQHLEAVAAGTDSNLAFEQMKSALSSYKGARGGAGIQFV